MKVRKFTLPEEDFTMDASQVTFSAIDEYDDDFSELDYELSDHLTAPEGPKSGDATGIADMLISAINDEWETIKKYNSIVATLRELSANSSIDYEGFINVINEINNEENIHVGQLQEVLKQISPNAHSIERGEEEGREQLNFVDGKLVVQAMPIQNAASTPTMPSDEEPICSLTDIDDEF